ncbi:MAG: glycosyltransferase, partial [bacterium]
GQEYQEISEVVVADNCSTDNSLDIIKNKYPKVRILTLPENKGPNPARNRILRESEAELVLLMDGDVVLSPRALSQLVDGFRMYPEAGIVTAQIRSYGKAPAGWRLPGRDYVD